MHCNTILSVLALICGVFSVALPLRLSPDKDFWYATITIGGQDLEFFVDTGAPQTWVATEDTQCYGTSSGARLSCLSVFGDLYTPSPTLTLYNDTYNSTSIQYADGSEVRGFYAFEDLVVGGESVEQARIVLAELEVSTSGGYWPASGLLGLAPEPPAVLDWAGPDTKSAMMLNRPYALAKPRFAMTQVQDASVPGHEFLGTIFNQTDNAAYFGLALSRTDPRSTTASSRNSSFAGLLTIGEDAPLDAPYMNASASNTFVRVPLEKTESIYYDTAALLYYIINCTAITIGRDLATIQVYPFNAITNPLSSAPDDAPFIVDSGTELIIVPSLHAALVNSHFSPPATYDASGIWVVDCDAQAPEIGMFIGGENFPINPLDLKAEFRQENRTKVCVSTVQGSNYGGGVLGSPFLKNVYAEHYMESYDGPEAATMWLASREFYATY